MILFLITFITVFLLAFQQQNVVGGHYKMAVLTSFAIGFTQFYTYRLAAFGDPFDWVYMSLGGAVGVVLSMYLHKRVLKK